MPCRFVVPARIPTSCECRKPWNDCVLPTKKTLNQISSGFELESCPETGTAVPLSGVYVPTVPREVWGFGEHNVRPNPARLP